MNIFEKAEDIYTAAGWESLYQNGYLHGSPSRFLAISAIYTAAGCQHIIAIYTAAVPEQIQTIYIAAVCLHKIAIYTAAIQEPNRPDQSVRKLKIITVDIELLVNVCYTTWQIRKAVSL